MLRAARVQGAFLTWEEQVQAVLFRCLEHLGMSPALTGADIDHTEARADTNPGVPAALKCLCPAAPLQRQAMPLLSFPRWSRGGCSTSGFFGK